MGRAIQFAKTSSAHACVQAAAGAASGCAAVWPGRFRSGAMVDILEGRGRAAEITSGLLDQACEPMQVVLAEPAFDPGDVQPVELVEQRDAASHRVPRPPAAHLRRGEQGAGRPRCCGRRRHLGARPRSHRAGKTAVVAGGVRTALRVGVQDGVPRRVLMTASLAANPRELCRQSVKPSLRMRVATGQKDRDGRKGAAPNRWPARSARGRTTARRRITMP